MALRAWKLALGVLVATGVVPSQPAWPGNTCCLQVKRQFLRCLLCSCLSARDSLVLFLTMDECGAAVEARVHCPHGAEGDDHASTTPSDTTMEPSLTSPHGFGLRTHPPKDVQRSGRFSNQPKGPFSHRFDLRFCGRWRFPKQLPPFPGPATAVTGRGLQVGPGAAPLREDGGVRVTAEVRSQRARGAQLSWDPQRPPAWRPHPSIPRPGPRHEHTDPPPSDRTRCGALTQTRPEEPVHPEPSGSIIRSWALQALNAGVTS